MLFCNTVLGILVVMKLRLKNYGAIMNSTYVKIAINTDSYLQLKEITQQLKLQNDCKQSKVLGEVLTRLTCEVLQKVFGVLLTQHQNDNEQHGDESGKILTLIEAQLHKYMPWSISLFSNQRLEPVANYILEKMQTDEANLAYLCYDLDAQLATRLNNNFNLLMQGQLDAIQPVFKDLIEVIDTGVTELIRVPKSMLEFNRIVDKTLTGVIHMLTSLGYKRIDKISKYAKLRQAQDYAQYFYSFLQ